MIAKTAEGGMVFTQLPAEGITDSGITQVAGLIAGGSAPAGGA